MLKKLLFILLAFCFIFFGCGHSNDSEEKNVIEKEILSRENNVLRKEDLISQQYAIGSSGIEYLSLSMEEINRIMEIECLRSISTGYYSVFMDKNGGWLYLFFGKEHNQYVVNDCWHTNGHLKKQDFDVLVPGDSTISQVRAIDPYGYEMFSGDTGHTPFSQHFTTDGYEVTISYDIGCVITQIEFYQDDSYLNKILHIDCNETI